MAQLCEIQARTVIAEHEYNFVSLLVHAQTNLPDRQLAAFHTLFFAFQAMHDGIPQQMLEWRHHFFQHAAVQLYSGTLQFKVGTLVQLLAGLTHDAIQPVGNAVERHHAHIHQPLLQILVDSVLHQHHRSCLVQVLQH